MHGSVVHVLIDSQHYLKLVTRTKGRQYAAETTGTLVGTLVFA
jgi:hypothetical protein